MKWITWAVVALLLVAVAAAATNQARVDSPGDKEITHVPGTKVSLVVPPGLSPSSTFTGFVDLQKQTSLVVVEIPGPYDEVKQGFANREALKRQGMKVLERTSLAMGEYDGAFYEIEQSVTEATVFKCVWMFGNDDGTVMVMGICPKGSEDVELEPLRRAVLSATWDPQLVLDPLAALPYQLRRTEGMQLVSSQLGSTLFTSDGEIDEAHTGKPMFLCAPSLRPYRGTRESFARRRLRQTKGVKQVKAGELKPVLIDGLEGLACVATARDDETNEGRFVYQVILFEGSAYWILHGQAADELREAYLPRFERITASFERKWDTLTSANDISRIEVPATWSVRSGMSDDADLQASHPNNSCYVIVLSEAKADFETGTTLAEVSRFSEAAFAEVGVESRAPEEAKVGELPALRCEYTLQEEGVEFLYVLVAVEGATHFHRIQVQCPKDSFELVQSDLTRILGSFREGAGQ